jgi:hypothetical protein
MKQYDSIDYFGDYWGLPILAFDKLDGSNLRFEFSHKRGFYKFGTRKQMIDKNSDFGFAIDLFLDKYNEGLSRIFKSREYRNIQNFVCYAELVGTKSAFGQHEFGNDIFDIVLFDIDQHKHGMIHPKEFVKEFGELGIPRVVYEGNLNKELIASVKANEFNLTEGVICKGVTETKKGRPSLYYCKIKTDDWFQRLRTKDVDQYELEVKQSTVPDRIN